MQRNAPCGRPKLFFRVDRTNSEASNEYGPSVFFTSVSSQSAFAHVVAGDLEKGKETVYGATRSGAIAGAQPLRRGAGDASDGALHTIDDMVHTRIMS